MLTHRKWCRLLNPVEMGLPPWVETVRPLSHLAPGCVTYDTSLSEWSDDHAARVVRMPGLEWLVGFLTHGHFELPRFPNHMDITVPFKSCGGLLVPARGGKIIDGEVLPGATVAPGVFGEHTEIRAGAIIDAGAHVGHSSIVGERVLIAAGAVLAGWVVVEDGSFVGMNATILPHVTVGAGAKVAAGAVVTKDVPPGARVCGNPARLMAVDLPDPGMMLGEWRKESSHAVE